MLRLIRSFSFAFNGIKVCTARHSNFKIHLFCMLPTIALAIAFRISVNEWVAVLLCIGLVLSMEMLNTAIEQLCDVVHKEYHPGIKVTKDIAAGAVLVSAVIAAVCGAFIFIPKILSFIQTI